MSGFEADVMARLDLIVGTLRLIIYVVVAAMVIDAITEIIQGYLTYVWTSNAHSKEMDTLTQFLAVSLEKTVADLANEDSREAEEQLAAVMRLLAEQNIEIRDGHLYQDRAA